MTRACPNCGHALEAPAKHRSELERQVGDVMMAFQLRSAAEADPDAPARQLWMGFIAWRGYVWAKVRIRHPAKCAVTGAEISAGGWAWRQLSEVKDRNLRVSADAWADL